MGADPERASWRSKLGPGWRELLEIAVPIDDGMAVEVDANALFADHAVDRAFDSVDEQVALKRCRVFVVHLAADRLQARFMVGIENQRGLRRLRH